MLSVCLSSTGRLLHQQALQQRAACQQAAQQRQKQQEASLILQQHKASVGGQGVQGGRQQLQQQQQQQQQQEKGPEGSSFNTDSLCKLLWALASLSRMHRAARPASLQVPQLAPSPGSWHPPPPHATLPWQHGVNGHGAVTPGQGSLPRAPLLAPSSPYQHPQQSQQQQQQQQKAQDGQAPRQPPLPVDTRSSSLTSLSALAPPQGANCAGSPRGPAAAAPGPPAPPPQALPPASLPPRRLASAGHTPPPPAQGQAAPPSGRSQDPAWSSQARDHVRSGTVQVAPDQAELNIHGWTPWPIPMADQARPKNGALPDQPPAQALGAFTPAPPQRQLPQLHTAAPHAHPASQPLPPPPLQQQLAPTSFAPPGWMAAALAVLHALIPHLQPKHLPEVLWALAALDTVPPPASRRRLAAAAAQHARQLSPKHLAAVVGGLPRARVTRVHDACGMLAEVLSAGRAGLHAMQPKEVCLPAQARVRCALVSEGGRPGKQVS